MKSQFASPTPCPVEDVGSDSNGTYLSCGHRELLPFKALAGRGALERAQGGCDRESGPDPA